MTNFKVKNVHCLGCNDNPNCTGSTIDFTEPIKEAEKRGEEKTRKLKCGCQHVEPDYWCICWFEGFETGEAEKSLTQSQDKENIQKK